MGKICACRWDCKHQHSLQVNWKYSKCLIRLAHLPRAGASPSFSFPGTRWNTLFLPGIFSLRKPNMHIAFSTTQKAQRNHRQQKEEYPFRKITFLSSLPVEDRCRNKLQLWDFSGWKLEMSRAQVLGSGLLVLSLLLSKVRGFCSIFWHLLLPPLHPLLRFLTEEPALIPEQWDFPFNNQKKKKAREATVKQMLWIFVLLIFNQMSDLLRTLEQQQNMKTQLITGCWYLVAIFHKAAFSSLRDLFF